MDDGDSHIAYCKPKYMFCTEASFNVKRSFQSFDHSCLRTVQFHLPDSLSLILFECVYSSKSDFFFRFIFILFSLVAICPWSLRNQTKVECRTRRIKIDGKKFIILERELTKIINVQKIQNQNEYDD